MSRRTNNSTNPTNTNNTDTRRTNVPSRSALSEYITERWGEGGDEPTTPTNQTAPDQTDQTDQTRQSVLSTSSGGSFLDTARDLGIQYTGGMSNIEGDSPRSRAIRYARDFGNTQGSDQVDLTLVSRLEAEIDRASNDRSTAEELNIRLVSVVDAHNRELTHTSRFNALTPETQRASTHSITVGMSPETARRTGQRNDGGRSSGEDERAQ